MSDDLRKRQLRRDAIARRKTVTRQERDAAAAALAEHIVPLLDLVGVQAGTSGVMSAPHGRGHRPPTVAAYVSMGSEIPMRPLLSLLLDRGLRVLVPRLGSGLDVGWALLPDMASLHGVACEGTGMAQRPDEPDTQTLGPAALGDADLIIVPALAVDAHGVRLGRGGGWYDRALTYRRGGVPVVAVCWPWECMADDPPRQSHDIPVDWVVTPQGAQRLQFAIRASSRREQNETSSGAVSARRLGYERT